MRRRSTRLKGLACALAVAIAAGLGCQKTDVPLIEFPNGAPPPPPASKPDPKGPQGIYTSKGDPSKPG